MTPVVLLVGLVVGAVLAAGFIKAHRKYLYYRRNFRLTAKFWGWLIVIALVGGVMLGGRL
jgi:hypothetical protein